MPDVEPASPTEDTVEDAFALDEDQLPVSWTLQVGSFKDQDKAVRLRASLRDSEYRSYITQANDTPEGDTYRVFVGPMLEKQKLREISEQIESKFDLKGLIVRYRIEDDTGQLGG
ncbi:MAG: SPOR domain-containing protein [Pseudomonadales bacterium]|nr:SPOR domain-containing protein [Pseudomonadales bacterium]